MKGVMIRSLVAGVVLTGAGLASAEDQAAPKKEAVPAQEVEHAPKAGGERKIWHGVLAAPATNAPADVVAVLAVKKGPVSSLKLTATDAAVVAQLKELAAKSARVSIKGALSADKQYIAVTACKEAKGEAQAKHRKPSQDEAEKK
jgi:hypothetical protein